jgi:hypothetical protein
MKQAMYGWALVLLVGFYASDYALKAGYSQQYIWIAWAIIFVVMNFAVGKSHKKVPEDVMSMWMTVNVFGFLATLAVAGGLVALPYAWLMSLWFILMGAAIFAGGHKMNSTCNVMEGVVFVFAALMVPTTGYFLYGSLVFGLYALVSTYFSKM